MNVGIVGKSVCYERNAITAGSRPVQDSVPDNHRGDVVAGRALERRRDEPFSHRTASGTACQNRADCGIPDRAVKPVAAQEQHLPSTTGAVPGPSVRLFPSGPMTFVRTFRIGCSRNNAWLTSG